MHPKIESLNPLILGLSSALLEVGRENHFTDTFKVACFLQIILAKVLKPHVLMLLNLVNHV